MLFSPVKILPLFYFSVMTPCQYKVFSVVLVVFLCGAGIADVSYQYLRQIRRSGGTRTAATVLSVFLLLGSLFLCPTSCVCHGVLSPGAAKCWSTAAVAQSSGGLNVTHATLVVAASAATSFLLLRGASRCVYLWSVLAFNRSINGSLYWGQDYSEEEKFS